MKKEYRYNHKGFYKVGSNHFKSKLEACLELNGIPGDHHLHWDYHEDMFSKARWQDEPPVSILELYKQRALQLREQYDHLVLCYSGGADSHTVLQAFINNNIKIDEILIYGAFKAEEEVIKKLRFDREPGYYSRESLHNAMPVVKELQKTHKFKITKFDYTDSVVASYKDPDWMWEKWQGIGETAYTLGGRDQPNTVMFDDESEWKGKKRGFIFGVDKPRLLRDDHSIYVAFIDSLIGFLHRYENCDFFYWSPNMPEIVIKQAHMIYKSLKETNRLHELPNINHLASYNREIQERLIIPVIYPMWNKNVWQIKKPSNPIASETLKWVFDSAKTKETKKQWFASIKEVERQIGGRHFNNNSVMSGLTGCYSKFYKIADISADSSRITVDSDRTL